MFLDNCQTNDRRAQNQLCLAKGPGEWTRLLRYGFDKTNKTSVFPEMLDDMRAYQASCRAASVDLRVSLNMMRGWIVDNKMLAIKLPAIRRQTAAAKKGKKGKKLSKKRSSK
jgi:hypothetical protein